jgi:hypothetical protein
MTYLDKTFCASPNCKNECDRKMTANEKNYLDKLNLENGFPILVCHAYFCGVPKNENINHK